MKIVLYSGGEYSENRQLDTELFRLIGVSEPKEISKISMTYIPTCNDEATIYYKEWCQFYREAYGIKKFYYLPLEKNQSANFLNQVFNSQIIYISGGNTFTLLRNLRKSGLAPRIKKFLRDGGALAGQSAGAIVMTPNIMLAQIPSYDSDENHVRLRTWSALSLVPFEFSPHYEVDEDSDQELITYSRNRNVPILGCEDGSGVVINGDSIKVVGPVVIFHGGQKYLPSPSSDFKVSMEFAQELKELTVDSSSYIVH